MCRRSHPIGQTFSWNLLTGENLLAVGYNIKRVNVLAPCIAAVIRLVNLFLGTFLAENPWMPRDVIQKVLTSFLVHIQCTPIIAVFAGTRVLPQISVRPHIRVYELIPPNEQLIVRNALKSCYQPRNACGRGWIATIPLWENEKRGGSQHIYIWMDACVFRGCLLQNLLEPHLFQEDVAWSLRTVTWGPVTRVRPWLCVFGRLFVRHSLSYGKLVYYCMYNSTALVWVFSVRYGLSFTFTAGQRNQNPRRTQKPMYSPMNMTTPYWTIGNRPVVYEQVPIIAVGHL